MPFEPHVDDQLKIEGTSYRVAEHPSAPGMPYGQEGRQAVVYKLAAGDELRALKVFKPRFRVPAMVALAQQMEPYAGLLGLQVCRRTVLTGRRERELLRQYPELTYAVLMPWIEGPTWMQVLLQKQELTAEQSLALARSMVDVLAGMEERGLAHCDLSGPNVMLPELAGGSGVALVDVEQMYGPELRRPQLLPGGSPGYAHRMAPDGLWSEDADRFAGAVLLAEMLCWCNERVVEAAWGENYFDPREMQRDSERYRLLLSTLRERWGEEVARLFERAWHSDALADCATSGEWLVMLPERVPAAAAVAEGGSADAKATTGSQETAAEALIDLAQELHARGDLHGALDAYEKAVSLLPTGSGLAARLAATIERLKSAERGGAAEEGAPLMEEPPTGGKEELDALFDAGLAAYEQQEWDKARELLGEVVRSNPAYKQHGHRAAVLLRAAEQAGGSWPWRRRILIGALVCVVALAIGIVREVRRAYELSQAMTEIAETLDDVLTDTDQPEASPAPTQVHEALTDPILPSPALSATPVPRGAAVMTVASLVIDPPSQFVGVGETVTVDIKADTVTNLHAADIQLTFDSAKLEVEDSDGDAANGVQVTPASFVDQTESAVTENVVDNSKGEIRYAFALTEPSAGTSGAVRLVHVTFVARDAGTAAISLRQATLLDDLGQAIGHSVVDGSITVLPDSSSVYAPSQDSDQPSPTAEVLPETGFSYTVQWGDTIYSIAQRFGLAADGILQANGLDNPNLLRAGQVLTIPALPPPPPGPVIYVIQPGDNLYRIALKFGVSVDAIISVNRIVNPWYTRAGQVLIIPTGVPPVPPPLRSHIVQPGDTVWAIAAMYRVTPWAIISLNNLLNPNLVFVGQVLRIP